MLFRSVPSKDIDIEVFGIESTRLSALLGAIGRVEPVGQAFPVYKVVVPGVTGEVDVALPRRESKTGRGHKGFDVRGDPSMSVVDAARRRDFTVNAISWDPLLDRYEDPFNGRADIDRRVLRAVAPDTFADDSLRVLRAIQFAARFSFVLDPATAALCRALPLDDLPAERIWGEFEKLLTADAPSSGFELARTLGVIDRLFPDLAALVGCPQEPEWHPEGEIGRAHV